ncbi:MAG: membrane protein insertase YidC, partial [candidate division Zixibacteria bacterium]|nr:membrane protein insertase YidC [candidate division Zixibacteria bacterium]
NGEKFNVSTPEGSIEARRITAGMVMEFAGVDTLRDSVTVFVGPLDYTLLSEYNVGLEDMLDIGTTPFVGWIIKPFAIAIIWVLPRMYDYVPNYGMVIILFALLVKIITLPLSMKSFKSMQAMRDLQPKIEELKVKHKKNPQAVNKEMMKLYKKHGVNPISGCLPMLPQMPLFFALFSVFRSTILLRDAPFVWFISDLSRGASGLTDPYMILVVIMVVAQFLSQKLTMPSTAQNKMIGYIMPLFMGFIFYKFAAGLVLYWVCFSVFSLLDYVLFKRRKNTEVMTT